jgi:hypothetical protein
LDYVSCPILFALGTTSRKDGQKRKRPDERRNIKEEICKM